MTDFNEFGLNDNILKAIEEMGYTEPTEIQVKSLPVLLETETHFIGLAQTGTGKTASYGLPLLQNIDFSIKKAQAIILSPTRELCMQIAREIEKFGKYIKGLKVAAVYGGVGMDRQIAQLKDGAQIIVATPGRMIDHLERKNAHLKEIKYVVLDEADEMLNMGFQEDIDKILEYTGEHKWVWLFSATMPMEIRAIASNYMDNPVEVSIGRKNVAATNLSHLYYQTDKDNRYEVLKRIVDYYPEIYGIIFTRTRAEAQDICEQLIRDGYNTDALHGDLSQQMRDKVMNRFREKSLQLLIATDVAARGLDVDNITHVIHYGLPDDIESYIHRSGRTARAGKKGLSMAIITKSHIGKLSALEKLIKVPVEKALIPTPQMVIEKRILHFFEDFKNHEINEASIKPYLPSITEQLEELTKEEIILRISSIEFQQVTNYYKNAVDLNTRGGAERGTSSSNIRFFINVGRKDGLEKMDLLDLIHDATEVPKKNINYISLKDTFSFFETPLSYKEKILSSFDGLKVNKRPVRIDVSGEETGTKKSYTSRDNDKKFTVNKSGGSGGGGSYGGGDKKKRRERKEW